MHNFTPNDLLQYLYKEASPSKSIEIKAALESDWNLMEQFEELSNAKDQLKALPISPNKKTINNILDYAASYERSFA